MPEWQSELVLDVSAGSRHTFIIDAEGKARVSGFIESLSSYRGHLGVPRAGLAEGPNAFTEVSEVVNSQGRSTPAPRFQKAYAGAGAPGDAGAMHSVLLGEDGTVYTAGSNSQGQLCRGEEILRGWRAVGLPEDVFREVPNLPG